jgi:hypothetical protein
MERFPDGRVDGRAIYELLVETARACAGGDGSLGRRIERAAWSTVHGVAWLVLEREIEPASDEVDVDAIVDDAVAVLIAGVAALTA